MADDFDKKYGGGTATATAPATGASDEFDKKYGASSTEKPKPTTADNEIERAGKDAFVTKHPYIAGAAHAVASLGGLIPDSTHASDYSLVPGIAKAVAHPIETAKAVNEGLIQPTLHAGQGRFDKMIAAHDDAKKQWNSGHPFKAANSELNAGVYGAEGTVPVIGPAIGQTADELEHGFKNRNTAEGKEELAHGVGTALTAGAMSNLNGAPNKTAAAVGEKIAPHIPEAVSNPRLAVSKKIWQPPVHVEGMDTRPATGAGDLEVPREGVIPAPGEVRPGAKTTAQVVGGASGALGGAVAPGHIPGLGMIPGVGAGGMVLGGIEGYKLGPSLMEKIFPEPPEWSQHRAMTEDLNKINNEPQAKVATPEEVAEQQAKAAHTAEMREHKLATAKANRETAETRATVAKNKASQAAPIGGAPVTQGTPPAAAPVTAAPITLAPEETASQIRPIGGASPEEQFQNSFGPEETHVKGQAEWDTGNPHGNFPAPPSEQLPAAVAELPKSAPTIGQLADKLVQKNIPNVEPPLKPGVPLKEQGAAPVGEKAPVSDVDARAERHAGLKQWDHVGRVDLRQMLIDNGVDMGQRIVSDAKGGDHMTRREAIKQLQDLGVNPSPPKSAGKS